MELPQDDDFRAELRKVYVGLIPETRSQWDYALTNLEAMPDNPEMITTVQRLGHNLKGTGASYGFPIVTEIGRRVDAMMKDNLARDLAVSKERIRRIACLKEVLFDVFDAITVGGNEFDRQQKELDRLDGEGLPD